MKHSEQLEILVEWFDIYDAKRGVQDERGIQLDLLEMARIFKELESGGMYIENPINRAVQYKGDPLAKNPFIVDTDKIPAFKGGILR